MILPCACALASSCNSTSKSVGARLRALTLTPMLISGAVCCGASDCGAAGFSKLKSLRYCAENAHRRLYRGLTAGGRLGSLLRRRCHFCRASSFIAFRLVGRAAIC